MTWLKTAVIDDLSVCHNYSLDSVAYDKTLWLIIHDSTRCFALTDTSNFEIQYTVTERHTHGSKVSVSFLLHKIFYISYTLVHKISRAFHTNVILSSYLKQSNDLYKHFKAF